MTTTARTVLFRAAAAGFLLAAFAPAVRAQAATDPGSAPITMTPEGEKPAAPAPAAPAAAPAETPPAATPSASIATAATTTGAADAKTANTLPATWPAAIEVAGSSVRLRSGPSEQYQTLKVLSVGDLLNGTASADGWVTVELPADAPCWVSASYVSDFGNGNGMVKGSRVNLRVSPGTTHYPIGQVSDKAIRFVLDEAGKPRRSGDWVQIVPPAEAKGYINASFVRTAPEGAVPAPAPAAAATAEAPAAGAADAKPADGIGSTVQVSPEDLARERAKRIADEAKAFRELDRLFLEELAKPSDQRDFAEMKLLYQQYSDSAEDQEIRAKSVERAKLIADTEAKIAAMVDDAKRRADEAKAAADKAEADRLAKVEAERSGANAPKEAPVTWLATGTVIDHGRDAKIPASHALCDADGNITHYIRWDTGDLDGLWQVKVRLAGTVSDHAGWDKPVIVISKCEKVTE